MKKCSQCRQYLDEEYFNFYKNTLQTFCKKCQSEYAKTYRKSNKKALRNNLQKWRQKNHSTRILSDKQKLEEEFRHTIRRIVNGKSSRQNKKLGYSPLQIREYFLSTFGQLPGRDYIIKYVTPLSSFDLSDENVWKVAGALNNLKLEKNERTFSR